MRKKCDYYCNLINRLKEYIEEEIYASTYYYELSQMAPTPFSRNLLLNFSFDERMHADNFMELYEKLTGKKYIPGSPAPIRIDDYRIALNERIIEETKDYKVYGDEYLMAPTKHIRKLFYQTRTVEAQHAMRIPILLAESNYCPRPAPNYCGGHYHYNEHSPCGR